MRIMRLGTSGSEQAERRQVMADECEKSEQGLHEVNWEKMSYRQHAGHFAAMFDIVCIHCGSLGQIVVEDDNADWD